MTGDETVARRVRLLGNQGTEHRSEIEGVGSNFMLADVVAALSIAGPGKPPAFAVRRQASTGSLDAAPAGHQWVTPPAVQPGGLP